MDSQLSGFYKLSVDERLARIREICGLDDEDIQLLKKGGLTLDEADLMRENVIGLYSLPFSIATNFRINGRDYLVPMVGEEPSVVAAASKAAKMARRYGGFEGEADEPVMIGEIQMLDTKNIGWVKENKEEILEFIDSVIPKMKERGGGARDIWVREVNSELAKYAIIYFTVDVRDAMGANTINKVAEALGEYLKEKIGGYPNVKILSNLAVYRMVRVKAAFMEANGNEKGVLLAQDLAENDMFRAATHNKGIMNGISALALATGNDTRGIESGAHSYAAYKWQDKTGYGPLTRYWVENGKLYGEIQLPVALGIVGGGTNHKLAKIALRKILQVKSAQELAIVAGALGLAQNFAALYAITKEGINKGHMRLHSKTLALMLGATPEEAAKVYEHFKDKEKDISMSSVKSYLEELRNG